MKYIYGLVLFAVVFILLDELSLSWWTKLNPAMQYQMVRMPHPTVAFDHRWSLNTAKSEINRFYPER